MMKLLALICCLTIFSCVKNQSSSVSSGHTTITNKKYFICQDNGSESNAELYTFFSNGKYIFESVYYTTTGCAVSAVKEKYLVYGNYSYNPATHEYTDLAYKLEIAYLSANEVAAQNAANQCGYNNWVINVLKDATDNDDCMGGTIYSNGTPYTQVLTAFDDTQFSDGTTTFLRVIE